MNNGFVSELRSQSCYPSFRAVVGFATAIGYLVAVGVAIFGLFAGFHSANVLVVVVACVVAVVVGIVVAVARELSLMLADIADAAISMAAGQDEQAASGKTPQANYMSATDLAALARRGAAGSP